MARKAKSKEILLPALAERKGVLPGGGHFTLLVGLSGVVVNGVEVESQRAADVAADVLVGLLTEQAEQPQPIEGDRDV